MGYYWRNLFLIVIVVYHGLNYSLQLRYFYVKRCPHNETLWRKHSDMLNCTWGTSLHVYHCLLTNDDRSIELCYQQVALLSGDGCPFFTEEGEVGKLRMRQRKCDGFEHECPVEARNPTFLSNEVYKYPKCLFTSEDTYSELTFRSERFYMKTSDNKFGIETTEVHQRTLQRSQELKESTLTINTLENDVKSSRIEKTRISNTIHAQSDFVTRKEDATIDGLVLSVPILSLGGGLIVLICIFVGCVGFVQCKRITKLKVRMEAVNYMSSVPYNESSTHPYQESENEAIYDYAYDISELSRRDSDSYLEPNKTTGGCAYPSITESCSDEDKHSYIIVIADPEQSL